MLRKPRPDSVIGSQLPPIIKDDVDTMLLSGESYRKVQQRLEEDAALDLAASPSCDPKALNILVGLILKAEQLAQDKRRLKILEAKAAQADAAKQVTQSTLTPEERDRKLRNIFGC